MFTRIQVKTRLNSTIIRNTTCLTKPTYLPSSKATPFNIGYRFRDFKTIIAHRAEQQTSQASNPVNKVLSDDIANMTRDQTAELYLDNVLPLKSGNFDIRHLIFRKTQHSLESKVNHAIPTEELPYNFAIKGIVARTKDGGAIVNFSFRSSDSSKLEVTKDIVERINDYILTNNIVASFNFRSLQAYSVKGSPFLEDFLARYPTQRLRIEFQGEAIGVEKLYNQLRRYGRIYDISLYPNPVTANDPSRYAIVQFTRVRSAASARNCLHGHYIDGTRLNILYESPLHTNAIKDWIIEHSQITIPIIIVIVGGITYAIFDPIREFSITSKVTQRFNIEEYKIYHWLRKKTWAHLVASGHDSSRLDRSVWVDDAEKHAQLLSLLTETPETFVLVTGNKGTGKSALVKSALKGRKNKIFIDCEEVASAGSQSEMIKNLAKEVGYFPVFTWVTSITDLIDTMVAATTGQRAGISSTPEEQIKEILETVAVALREIVPTEKEARERKEDSEHRFDIINKLKGLISGKKHQHLKTADDIKRDKLADNNNVPVIVIDNFMCRETSKAAKLWEELAEWGALLVENEIAHVMFVSSNAGVMKTLGKSLPGKSFSELVLSDAPTEKAMDFVNKELGFDCQDPNLLKVVSALGGRLTELELLVQKMRMDLDAQSAFEDIVRRNLIEVCKNGFGDTVDENQPEWTATQFWTIVKLFTDKASINYDELKWGPVFNGEDGPLQAMERAELIDIILKDGRANSIRPGKPVYQTVFNRLVSDSVFSASMEVESNIVLRRQAEEKISKLEDQIHKLTHIYPSAQSPKEIEKRIRFKLNKIDSVQKLIEQYDRNIRAAKAVISKDWADYDE